MCCPDNKMSCPGSISFCPDSICADPDSIMCCPDNILCCPSTKWCCPDGIFCHQDTVIPPERYVCLPGASNTLLFTAQDPACAAQAIRFFCPDTILAVQTPLCVLQIAYGLVWTVQEASSAIQTIHCAVWIAFCALPGPSEHGPSKKTSAVANTRRAKHT